MLIASDSFPQTDSTLSPLSVQTDAMPEKSCRFLTVVRNDICPVNMTYPISILETDFKTVPVTLFQQYLLNLKREILFKFEEIKKLCGKRTCGTLSK